MFRTMGVGNGFKMQTSWHSYLDILSVFSCTCRLVNGLQSCFEFSYRMWLTCSAKIKTCTLLSRPLGQELLSPPAVIHLYWNLVITFSILWYMRIVIVRSYSSISLLNRLQEEGLSYESLGLADPPIIVCKCTFQPCIRLFKVEHPKTTLTSRLHIYSRNGNKPLVTSILTAGDPPTASTPTSSLTFSRGLMICIIVSTSFTILTISLGLDDQLPLFIKLLSKRKLPGVSFPSCNDCPLSTCWGFSSVRSSKNESKKKHN